MSDNYKKIIEEAREKIHSTFNGLQFKEDTHQYFVNGKEYDCVSNFTHNYKPYANFDEIAKRYAKNMDLTDHIGLKSGKN